MENSDIYAGSEFESSESHSDSYEAQEFEEFGEEEDMEMMDDRLKWMGRGHRGLGCLC